MTLIVGLGNPGREYAFTRHNAGFLALDSVLLSLSSLHISFKSVSSSSFKGEVWKMQDYIFLKPSTFMNLSGQSVVAVCHFYKCDTLIVMYDDIDLPFGALRFKSGGGNGGHNGLRSIDLLWGCSYYRVRIGVGKPKQSGGDIAHYVLSSFAQEELQILQEKIFTHSTQAILALIKGETWEKVSSLYSLKGL